MRVKITRDGRTTTAVVEPDGLLAGDGAVGKGVSTCDPGDHYVPKIGDRIAVGRALEDLGRQVAERWSARAVTKEQLVDRRQAKTILAAPRPPRRPTSTAEGEV